MKQIKVFSLITFAFIAVLGFYYWMSYNPNPHGLIVSENDTRQYRIVTLQNGLKAILVSDPASEKASIAMNVGVGSLDEPKDTQGIAHFLEHMLFLGTKKYPGMGEYQKFIESHGGRTNAFTRSDRTVYFFDIFANHLEAGMDRFSQFFITPLFNEDMVNKEKHAVHSEFKMHLKNDFWRTYQVSKTLANPEHPYHLFTIGNLDTLSKDSEKALQQKVIAFYDQHYSADNMTVAIYGSQDLDTLESWLQRYFSDIKRLDTPYVPDYLDKPLYTSKELAKWVKVKSVGDKNKLYLSFPIPSQNKSFKTKAADYIAALLQQKNPGSLYKFLLSENLINDMDVGYTEVTAENGFFDIDFDLTTAGLESVKTILTHLFQYLRLIDRQGIDQWRFDELQQIADMQFRFEEKTDPFGAVIRLSDSLHQFPEKYVVAAKKRYFEFSPAAIQELLAQLVPTNAMIYLLSKDVKGDSVEPYFQTEYQAEKIPHDWLTAFSDDTVQHQFALPPQNPYIAKNIRLLQEEQATAEPILLGDGPVKSWCMTDTKFNSPLVDYRFAIIQPSMNATAEHAVMVDIYLEYLSEKLSEILNQALVAGNRFHLKRYHHGLYVSTTGYSLEILKSIIEKINHEMLAFEVDNNRFQSIKHQFARSYRDTLHEAPAFKQAHELSATLIKTRWSDADKLLALKSVDREKLVSFLKGALSAVDVESFAYGNVVCEQIESINQVISSAFHLNDHRMAPENVVVQIPAGKILSRTIQTKHNDSALLTYHQPTDKSDDTFAKLYLLEQILSEPFHTNLRTKQQLGYIAAMRSKELFDTIGLFYLVQSPTAKSAALYEAFQKFHRTTSLELLQGLTEDKLATYQQAVVNRLLKKPINRQEEVRPYLREIFDQTYQFDRKQRIAELVKETTKEMLLATHEALHVDNEQRTALVLQTEPFTIPDWPESMTIGSLTQFKANAVYY